MCIYVYTVFIWIYTSIFFVLDVRVSEGTAPFAMIQVVVYIDGSFVKHKVPVKPIIWNLALL